MVLDHASFGWVVLRLTITQKITCPYLSSFMQQNIDCIDAIFSHPEVVTDSVYSIVFRLEVYSFPEFKICAPR